MFNGYGIFHIPYSFRIGYVSDTVFFRIRYNRIGYGIRYITYPLSIPYPLYISYLVHRKEFLLQTRRSVVYCKEILRVTEREHEKTDGGVDVPDGLRNEISGAEGSNGVRDADVSGRQGLRRGGRWIPFHPTNCSKSSKRAERCWAFRSPRLRR